VKPKPSKERQAEAAKAPETKTVNQNPAEETEQLAGHNVVRLELVLNPEQLKGFFGAVIATQHSVLTLREAASLLRVSQSSLERLAEEGNVPGVMVDHKWRFTRTALDEWLNTHSTRKGA
jgi:excisionase family DNA binding protein